MLSDMSFVLGASKFFFLQIKDYIEVVAPKIRKPVHKIFIKIYLSYDHNNFFNG